MNKLMILIIFLLCGLIGFSQPISDSAKEAYYKYLVDETSEMILRAITDTVYVDNEADFSDYSIKGVTDTSIIIATKRCQLQFPKKDLGWILESFKKNKKHGFWIYSRSDGLLIERWRKGVLKTRRWILEKG